MAGYQEQALRAVCPATVCRRAAGGGLCLLLLSGFYACADDAQPDPPDMAGAAGEDDCPSDLPSSSSCSGALPSYEREVAPIIEQRCATCHYPGNTQSGDVFAEYADVYSRRQTLLTRVYTCAMPPEGAAAPTPEERQALLRWFVCGAPEN